MREKDNQTSNDRPEYIPPTIKTYTSEELMEEIGPAQACTPSPGCTSQGCGQSPGGAPNPGWDSDSACGVSPKGNKLR